MRLKAMLRKARQLIDAGQARKQYARIAVLYDRAAYVARDLRAAFQPFTETSDKWWARLGLNQ